MYDSSFRKSYQLNTSFTFFPNQVMSSVAVSGSGQYSYGLTNAGRFVLYGIALRQWRILSYDFNKCIFMHLYQTPEVYSAIIVRSLYIQVLSYDKTTDYVAMPSYQIGHISFQTTFNLTKCVKVALTSQFNIYCANYDDAIWKISLNTTGSLNYNGIIQTALNFSNGGIAQMFSANQFVFFTNSLNQVTIYHSINGDSV